MPGTPAELSLDGPQTASPEGATQCARSSAYWRWLSLSVMSEMPSRHTARPSAVLLAVEESSASSGSFVSSLQTVLPMTRDIGATSMQPQLLSPVAAPLAEQLGSDVLVTSPVSCRSPALDPRPRYSVTPRPARPGSSSVMAGAAAITALAMSSRVSDPAS